MAVILKRLFDYYNRHIVVETESFACVSETIKRRYNVYSEKLFRTLILATCFSITEIGKFVRFTSNHREFS